MRPVTLAHNIVNLPLSAYAGLFPLPSPFLPHIEFGIVALTC
jgi:hypothetical protein